MAFIIGSTTVIDNSRNITSGTANGTAATPTGFKNSGGNDTGELIRFTTYTDDKGNCRGYLPNGNCLGNNTYDPPNNNWWTWGVTGVPTTNCGNVMGAAGNANCQTAFYPVNMRNLIYDSYYELYNRIRGSEQHRGYSNCNCNQGYNTIGNCYNNCACNCNC